MQARHILLTVFFFLSFSAGAQKWFPIGAAWNYFGLKIGISRELVTISVQKDTVVNGTSCKLLNQVEYYSRYFSNTIDTLPYPPLLAWERNDSVYFWQGDSFVLIYNLNMQVGDTSSLTAFNIDTILVPIGCTGNQYSPGPVADVDSIYSINVGGQSLKVLSDTFNQATTPYPSIDIERIGNNKFLIPQVNCGVAIAGATETLFLTCYTDSVIGTYVVPNSGSCNPFLNTDLEIQFSGDYTVCPGTVMSLSANANGGTPPYSYQWSVNGGGILSCDTCAYPLLTVNSNTTIELTVTDANRVSVSGQVNYTTGLGGQINIAANGRTSLCQGGTDTLSLTGNYDSYVWSNGDTTSSIVVSQSGNYTVTVTSGVSCTGSGNISVNIASNPAPQSITGNPSITSYQEYTYAVNQVSGISYRWLVQGGAIQSGQGTNAITVLWGDSSSNMITLIQINTYGCADTATLQVLNTGIQSLNDNDIKLYFYAAPENNIIRVVNSIPRAYTLSLFDISGRMVFNCKSRSDQNILPGTLSPGAYIARLNFPGGIIKNLKILIR